MSKSKLIFHGPWVGYVRYNEPWIGVEIAINNPFRFGFLPFKIRLAFMWLVFHFEIERKYS